MSPWRGWAAARSARPLRWARERAEGSRSRVDAVHDVSLAVWAGLAAAHAAGRHRAGPAGAVAVGVNLLAGSPAAPRRVRLRRRDPVALLAPVAVAGALVTSAGAGPRWAPLAAVTVLIGLAVAERRA